MRIIGKALTTLGAVCLAASPAQADTICDWMDYADKLTATLPPGAPPTGMPGREQATTQLALAMFEAVNAIDRRYESYVAMPLGEATASQDAAAATAAYLVLSHYYSAQKTGLDESYAVAMQAVANAEARALGVAIGTQAAKAALAVGGTTPGSTATPYRPRTSPGVWVGAQLPEFDPASFTLKPWVVKSFDQLRPPAPPALTSERWARDLDEVKRLGARDGAARTPHQTLMARYRITPNMAPSFRLIADAPGRSLVRNARMFALWSMASDDAGRSTAAAKLHYNLWRPITAIRNAEDDGNPATVPDAGWAPLINTPNHPEYPCGHCTFAATTAAVLKSEVGNAPPGGVRVSSLSIPNSAVQVLPTFDDWVREVSFSRTLGGVHYRFSNEAGEAIGRQAGELAIASVLRPLPKGRQRPALN